MNGLLAQPSSPPLRPPQSTGRAPKAHADVPNGTAKRMRPRNRRSSGGGAAAAARRGGKLPGSKLASATPLTSADVSASEDVSSDQSTGSDSPEESDPSRQQRFQNVDPGNQYEQLKVKRDVERMDAIAKGLIHDPNKPRALSEAIHFQGTCLDMCPEFEMHQREYQNNVEKFEIDPSSGRISKFYAVKAFHRPAAGIDQPLPSDVRPPQVLVKTLDYLFSTIMEGGDDLYSTHAFIRDRTRSVRQDFTLQNYRGREAIDCHERIARYHILCLHALCDNPNFSEQQEMEQLRKVLQSLMEFYKDTKMSSSPLPLPNEAEFRAYFALVFLRDPDVSQQLQTLPQNIFFSPPLMRSLRLRSWALRSNDKYVQNNAEAAPNSFVRFFKETAASTTFLEACILETWFGSIRTGALKALRQALGVKNPQVSQVSVAMLVQMLGFDNTEQFITFCDYLSLEIIYDEETNEPKSVWFKKSTLWEEPATYLHQFSSTVVEAKRGSIPYQAIVNGLHPRTPNTVAQRPPPKSTIPSTPLASFSTPRPKLPSIPALRPTQPPPKVNGPLAFKVPAAPASSPFGRPQPSFGGLSEAPPIPSTPPKPPPQTIINEAPLTTPVPVRPIKPILELSPPLGNSTSTPAFSAPEEQPARPVIQINSVSLPSTSKPIAPPIIQPLQPSLDVPVKPSHAPKASQPDGITRRRSLFERQEKLLRDQLSQQEAERKLQMDLEETQRKEYQERLRQQTRERQLTRANESALLERQKEASKAQQKRAHIERERQKVERERNIQFYMEEIVGAVIREHVFEVTADVLAVEHYRKRLLRRTLFRIKKIGARSLRRKQVHVEELRQLRNRKRLLAKALNELDNRAVVNTTKRRRRQSHHLPFEDEDEFEELLIKAREASKVAWKPLEIEPLLSSYVDNALSKAGIVHSVWNLLILSMNDGLSENLRWLRTKLGFSDDKTITLRIPSDVAQISITWSSVMQFSGSLENVGALVFVCERLGSVDNSEGPSAGVVLHEVVRQISLQSRYRYPLLIINFANAASNASDVAGLLDLPTLSQSTTSVPAIQVLTIDDFGNANLTTSIRSFFRHITGARNESNQDAENGKKRKRDTIGAASRALVSSVEKHPVSNSPPQNKKLRNEEEGRSSQDKRKSLPKSIESLYESIFNAEQEMEAGRALEEEEHGVDVVT